MDRITFLHKRGVISAYYAVGEMKEAARKLRELAAELENGPTYSQPEGFMGRIVIAPTSPDTATLDELARVYAKMRRNGAGW